MFGYIYKTTNSINNKIYIGQHKASAFKDKYKGSGKLLREAFKKYGKDKFKVELLEWCETQEEADQKEIDYINLYNSRDKAIGYNITRGGQKRFFTGMKHSKQDIEKMSAAKIGKKLAQSHIKNIIKGKTGQHYPEESNKRRAQTLHEKYLREGRISPHKGHKMSEEAKEKLRQSHLGKKYSDETKQKMSKIHTGIKHKPHKKHNYPTHRRTNKKHI